MKIAIIRLSSIGDIILTEPVCKNIKSVLFDSKIIYITKRNYNSIPKLFNSVDKVIDYESIDKTSHLNFDIVIDLHKKLSTFLLRRIIKSKKQIVYSKNHFLRTLMIKKLTKKEINSVVTSYLKVLTKIQIMPEFLSPELELKNSENNGNIKKLLESYNLFLNKNIIAVFPGAKHATKQYPKELFVEIIDNIPEHWQCQICIVGSSEDKFIAQYIKRKSKRKIVDLSGTFSLQQLPFAINIFDIIISNDSGPMHIAAALSKPQIAIFGSTHTKLGFRPVNEKAVVLQSDISCQPCSLHGRKECPKGTLECMYRIDPDLVVSSIKTLLEKFVWKV